MCEIGGLFDKNSFILGTKLNVLKNFLLRVEKGSTASLKTPVLICSQHVQSFIEKSPVFLISWVCKTSAACVQIQGKQSTDAYQISLPTTVFSTPRFDLFDPETLFIVSENKYFFFHWTRQVEPFMLHCFEAHFYWSQVYSRHFSCNSIF